MTTQHPTQPQWGQPPVTPQPRPSDPRRSWYKRGWVIATAAFLLGLGLGGAVSGTPEPKTVTQSRVVEKPYFTPNCDEVENGGQKIQCERVVAGYEQSLQSPATTTPPTTAAKPKPALAPTFSDGLYKVGEDIKPGNYRTSGGEMCYYARLKTDDTTSYIANHISSGPMRMTVRSSDGYVELSGGCEWRKVV
jgi:hypothetical protein